MGHLVGTVLRMNVTPHFVVPDAAEAAAWYGRAFGAEETLSRPTPERDGDDGRPTDR